jgi:ubiquitin C-terminal hydrolase
MGVFEMPIDSEVDNTAQLAYQPIPTCAILQIPYRLVAAVVHLGCRVGNGHYTTAASRLGGFYLFNDDTVTPVS